MSFVIKGHVTAASGLSCNGNFALLSVIWRSMLISLPPPARFELYPCHLQNRGRVNEYLSSEFGDEPASKNARQTTVHKEGT